MARLERTAVLASVREIAEQVLAPVAAGVDTSARWPAEGVHALQHIAGGLVIPADAGGLGLDMLAVAQVGEITGRQCASTSLCFGMHLVASAVLAAKATDTHREQLLGPIAAGQHLTTLALSEPGTGSEFWLPQTSIGAAGEGQLSLSGTKSFVTNGNHADSYVVSAVSASTPAEPGRFSMVVLDAATPGLQWGPAWSGFGMRGNNSRSLLLREVHVPRDALLGEAGDEIWYVFNVVAPYFLIAMSGTYLGVADAALARVREHLKRRRHTHSGRTLADIGVLQHRLGMLWARVEASRRLLYHAAQQADEGDSDAILALCSAKAEIASTVETVTNEAMTLAGGIGYGTDDTLHRLLRDGRAAHVMSPTTDILRTWVGRALLGEPLLQA